MHAMENETDHINENSNRRSFVKKGLIVTLSGVAGISLFPGCSDEEEKEGDYYQSTKGMVIKGKKLHGKSKLFLNRGC